MIFTVFLGWLDRLPRPCPERLCETRAAWVSSEGFAGCCVVDVWRTVLPRPGRQRCAMESRFYRAVGRLEAFFCGISSLRSTPIKKSFCGTDQSKSTPACWRVWMSLATVSKRGFDVTDSMRATVGSETPERSARSFCDQFRAARPARIAEASC